MEFNFTIAPYFKSEITKLDSRLIPEGFRGDRREVQECVNRMSLIITVLGENSAKAQGLQKTITSGDRLRNSDHTLYVYAEQNNGSKGNGMVIGMLKTGVKRLYLFDSTGENHEVFANCILDFYVHESRQRTGLGKKLFEYMLLKENISPKHLAIDKPSDKFLAFLRKHYGLDKTIPQMNNFVLFEGFFEDRQVHEENLKSKSVMAAGINSSMFRNLSGGLGTFTEPDRSKDAVTPIGAATPSSNGLNPFGRPPIHKPVSTLGQILQQQETPVDRIRRQTSGNVDEEKPDGVTNVEVIDTSELHEALEELAEEESSLANADDDNIAGFQEENGEITADENAIDEKISAETAAEPLACKVQAAVPQRLDLKFYHSSLW